jgi:hypothetical protein
MFVVRHPGAGSAVPAARHPRQKADVIAKGWREKRHHGAPCRRRVTPRLRSAGALLLAAGLMAAPWLVNDYLLTVLILILYFAYTGQAWNIMMGFAGQLSLGHAIYARPRRLYRRHGCSRAVRHRVRGSVS